MKRFAFKGREYLLAWAALLLAVGTIWLCAKGESLFGKGKEADSTLEVLPAEEALTLPAPQPEPVKEEEPVQELRGVWVPYFSLTGEEYTQKAFEENFRGIVETAKEKGLNALFVHVRPFCDALYPSKLYPWSHVLTGEQGKDPGFDPLEFMVDCAHHAGLQFHAWLNPLRVKTPQTEFELCDENPYLQLYDASPYYFMEQDGGIYLNPAYPYVRTMIAQGAGEIVKNYEVDGVHFDDYFYPSEDEALDRDAYELYVQSVEMPVSLLEWRQGNINAMVQEVYQAVKKEKRDVQFGISPQGNLSNDERMGADVRTWCAVPGYLDYICPQLYYSFENPALGFSEALDEWQGLKRHDGLKLYAGLALYKAGSDADDGTWLSSEDILRRQTEAARATGCAGVVLYSVDYLSAQQTAQEVAALVGLLSGKT